MNNYLTSRYKPYRYTVNKGITIIDCSLGRYIVKKQIKELDTLFNYLDSVGFTNHPIIDYKYKNEKIIMEYVKEDYISLEQKTQELAKVVALLHSKTVYFKNTFIDNYKEIKDIIEENINYANIFYEGEFLKGLKKEFQSPSEYLLGRNYYKIISSLQFAKEKLDKWYEKVNKERFRVSIIHNNLELDHFIYNYQNSILIGWEQYRIDSPIIDIINLYKKEFDKINFKVFLDEYLKRFELLDIERELLFIILSIPFPLNLEKDDELIKIQKIKNMINYLYQSESLIRPYYSKEKET